MVKISPADIMGLTDTFMLSPTLNVLPGRGAPALPTGTVSANALDAKNAAAVRLLASASKRRPLDIGVVLLGVLDGECFPIPSPPCPSTCAYTHKSGHLE